MKWIENQVIERIRGNLFFSLQLDESTDIQGLCQLLIFVRYTWNFVPHEDMLFCEPVSRSTSDEIFNTVNTYIRAKNLDWHKCLGICTDGARAMCSRNSGVVTRILELNPNASWTHCNLLRAALVSKHISDNFENVLNTSVKIVNFIKSKPLQSHLFEKLCEEMGSDHKSLLLHAEIQWLSRGKVLTRLAELREEVAIFLEDKSDFAKYLHDKEFVLRLTYLADIFSKLNDLNLYLQGTEGISIFAIHEKIRGFMKKLVLWKNHINNQNYDCFETFETFVMENKAKVDDGLIIEISEHLNKLNESFEFYFHKEMNTMQQKRWIMNPFQPDVTTGISTKVDEELIDLSEDSSLKMTFNTQKLVQFWASLQTSYPIISTEALKVLLPFTSSYISEAGFSAMVGIKSKYRNKLQLSNSLLLKLSRIEPDVNSIIERSKKQAHPSHRPH
ncbi:zinc finger BED domain-containing protein 5-like [Octopus sinensis]|uniref:Zinc finger BED domain-containing protein 5-like n=1 Tax=Octopus sinensis TaxID=2607531 RepID=A0A7E6ERV7_9MOLL|nr:zinc finger BED domain-containing protein 5-like [Octopus sinensis]